MKTLSSLKLSDFNNEVGVIERVELSYKGATIELFKVNPSEWNATEYAVKVTTKAGVVAFWSTSSEYIADCKEMCKDVVNDIDGFITGDIYEQAAKKDFDKVVNDYAIQNAKIESVEAPEAKTTEVYTLTAVCDKTNTVRAYAFRCDDLRKTIVSGRMARGETCYMDFIEVNPDRFRDDADFAMIDLIDTSDYVSPDRKFCVIKGKSYAIVSILTTFNK